MEEEYLLEDRHLDPSWEFAGTFDPDVFDKPGNPLDVSWQSPLPTFPAPWLGRAHCLAAVVFLYRALPLPEPFPRQVDLALLEGNGTDLLNGESQALTTDFPGYLYRIFNKLLVGHLELCTQASYCLSQSVVAIWLCWRRAPLFDGGLH